MRSWGILSAAICSLFLHAFQANAAPNYPCEQVDATVLEIPTLVERHRFQEIITLIEPNLACDLSDENEYILKAELGRAYYHLARYAEAHQMLRRAVTLRPQTAETAIYLQASLYLTGREDHALTIFEQLLKAGARDLYQAITLPGERGFLADPRVWNLLHQYEQSVPFRFGEGSFLGVRLGDQRQRVIAELGLDDSGVNRRFLSAQAGPHLLWAFEFDDFDRLSSIVVNAQYLLRYTPMRLQFDHGLDWRLTATGAISVLGEPDVRPTNSDSDVVLGWRFADFILRLTFAKLLHPGPPEIPADASMISRIEIVANSGGKQTQF